VAAGESAAWTIRAAEAVRLLGMTSNPVFDISRTAGPLAALLGDKNTEVSMAAARALAAIGGARAQQALVAAAMDGKSQERIRIDILGLLSGSLRRFGNQLTDAQSQSVVELVVDAKQAQPLRDAAAEAMGAMNLPSEKIKSLILESVRTD